MASPKWETDGPVQCRRVAVGAGWLTREVKIPGNVAVPIHRHRKHAERVTLVSGALSLLKARQSPMFSEPGTSWDVARDEVHSYRAGPAGATLVEVWTGGCDPQDTELEGDW